MRTRFVEATQSLDRGFNHGKFLIGQFDHDEWERASEVDKVHGVDVSLLRRCGWSRDHLLVLDLATGEGAMFVPGGMPKADLDKHKVWVCPMFEPFLGWLYEQWRERLCVGCKRPWSEWGPLCGGMTQGDMTHFATPDKWIADLPSLVELPDAEPALAGYRRTGAS